MLESSGIIFFNENKEILLLLRDDIPSIQFPNHWDFLGGVIEIGENPIDALKRELMEEIQYKLEEPFELFDIFEWKDGRREYIYYKFESLDISKITLYEGQKIEYISLENLFHLPLGFNDEEILQKFVNNILNE